VPVERRRVAVRSMRGVHDKAPAEVVGDTSRRRSPVSHLVIAERAERGKRGSSLEDVVIALKDNRLLRVVLVLVFEEPTCHEILVQTESELGQIGLAKVSTTADLVTVSGR